MTVPGRILAGLLFIFGLFQQSSAETIPFDYWYGRIIGRSQIQAVHDAYNGQYGVLTTSMKVGHGNDVSVNLGTLFDITEANQSNALLLSPRRPALSANVALGPRLRWQIDRLDWQESSSLSFVDEVIRTQQQSSFSLDLAIRMMHKDIEFDSTRSLYYYTSGVLLQPRNWILEYRIENNTDDVTQLRIRQQFLPHNVDTGTVHRRETADSRRWQGTVDYRYGISRSFQFQVGAKLLRHSLPSLREEEVSFKGTSDSLSTSGSAIDWVDHEYRLSAGTDYLQGERQWVGMRTYFASRPDNRDELITRIENGSSTRDESIKEDYEDRTYGLAVNHHLIIGGHSVTRAQLLDDFAGYYRRRLSPRSICFATKGELSFRRQHAERSISDELRGRFTFDQHDYREDILTVSSEVTYYSQYHLDLSLSLSLSCASRGEAETIAAAEFSHTQSRYFTIQCTYSSFCWDPSKRREISWDKISDIDYLYGPLLRPLDVRVSITVTPPADRWSYVDKSESVFNFFKGESDNLWVLSIASAFGLCDGLEAGLAASFRQYSPPTISGHGYLQKIQQDDWSVMPNFRWQPGSRFRVDFTLLERYDDYDSVIQYEEVKTREHSYEHSWEIIVKYNILI